jgi:hypothetical protein
MFLLVQSVELSEGDASLVHHSVRDGVGPALTVSEYGETVRGTELESAFAADSVELRGRVRTVSVRNPTGSLRVVTVSCFCNHQQADISLPRCRELVSLLQVKP